MQRLLRRRFKSNEGLKNETRIQHEGTVVQVEARSGDLFADAENEPESSLEVAPHLQRTLAIAREKLFQQELLREARRHTFGGADAEVGEHQADAAIRLRIVEI